MSAVDPDLRRGSDGRPPDKWSVIMAYIIVLWAAALLTYVVIRTVG